MKKNLLPLTFMLLLVLVSCTKQYAKHSFFAMDTFISVEADDTDKAVMEGLEELVYSDERKFSRTFSGSGIYEFNKTSDGTMLSEDTVALIEKAFTMYKKTDGAFSPFMGTLTELWNIKSENPRVPSHNEIQAALKNCDPSFFSVTDGIPQKTNPDLMLDLGGIAKGECAQNCIEYLKQNGVENAVLSFGGNVACIGHSPRSEDCWNIGIKNPFDTDDIIGSLNITDCYISASGAYERSFVKNDKVYHHILDEKTGYPAESDIESTAVISRDGAVADGLSTALLVMGSKKALDFYSSGAYEFEAILIMKDGSITLTPGISDCFSFNEKAKYKNGNFLVYNK